MSLFWSFVCTQNGWNGESVAAGEGRAGMAALTAVTTRQFTGVSSPERACVASDFAQLGITMWVRTIRSAVRHCITHEKPEAIQLVDFSRWVAVMQRRRWRRKVALISPANCPWSRKVYCLAKSSSLAKAQRLFKKYELTSCVGEDEEKVTKFRAKNLVRRFSTSRLEWMTSAGGAGNSLTMQTLCLFAFLFCGVYATKTTLARVDNSISSMFNCLLGWCSPWSSLKTVGFVFDFRGNRATMWRIEGKTFCIDLIFIWFYCLCKKFTK